jgi:hypothetical protein
MTVLPPAVEIFALPLALAVLAAGSWLVGRAVIGRLLPAGPLAAALALATGLTLIAQLLFLAALFGWLKPAAAITVLVALALAGRAARARSGGDSESAGSRWRLTRTECSAWLAGYPPTGFDETTYHLPMARAFATSGGLPVLPSLRYPVFPALSEALAAGLWLLGGERATHAGSQLAVLATGALLFARGIEEGRREAGWLAAALYLGSPLAVYLGSAGYVEPLLALGATAALLCVERWRGSGAAGWLMLAGLFAGSAAATKYLGVFALGYVAIDVLVAARRRPWQLASFAAVALLAAAPTYLRIWVLTGNPLFPFYPGLFGASAWSDEVLLGKRGTARLGAAATALWDAAFRRQRMGSMPPLSPRCSPGMRSPSVAPVAGRSSSSGSCSPRRWQRTTC